MTCPKLTVLMLTVSIASFGLKPVPASADTPTPAPPAPPAPRIQDCIDRMTAGVEVGDGTGNLILGSRTTRSDTDRYPRYTLDVANRVCGQNISHWKSAVDCMDRATGGVETPDASNNLTGRSLHTDQDKYPRYGTDNAAMLCTRSQGTWRNAINCMDRLVGGVDGPDSSNNYTSRVVHSDTQRYPRYREDQGALVCARAGDQWHPANNCLDLMTAGIEVGDGQNNIVKGERVVRSDRAKYPLYPIEQAAPICAVGSTKPAAKACMTNLTTWNANLPTAALPLSTDAIIYLCTASTDPAVQDCVTQQKSTGTVFVNDIMLAQACVTNPHANAAAINSLPQCLNTTATGQQVSGSANPSALNPAGGGGSGGPPALASPARQ